MRNVFLFFGALLLLLVNFIAQNFVYILGGVAAIFFLVCIAGIVKRQNDEKSSSDTDVIKCRLCQKQISGFSGVGFPDSDSIELLRKYGRKTGNICRLCAGAKMAKLEKGMAPYIKRGEPYPEPKVAPENDLDNIKIEAPTDSNDNNAVKDKKITYKEEFAISKITNPPVPPLQRCPSLLQTL